MSDDDLIRLRAALKSATPAPDAATRAAHLARAMESFDAAQETAGAARPNSDRPQGTGFFTGLRAMLSKISLHPVLAASTSVAALALGTLIVLPVLRQGPVTPMLRSEPQQSSPAEVASPPAPPSTAALNTEADAGRAMPEAAPAPEPAPAAAITATDGAIVGQLSDAPAPAPMAEVQLAPMAKRAVGLTAAPDAIAIAPAEGENESFANADPNPVRVAADDPVSTFSADVDTASWSILRSSLSLGQLPPAEAVRIEELVNYFPYDYPAPAAGEAPFRADLQLVETPWNADTRILRIGLQGRLPAIADRPPLNLVFLIDTSGSMQDANKLPLLQQAFRLMLGQLRPEDEVAIVTYAGSAGEVLEPTAAADRATILAALDRLDAGGSTAGAEGLALAYRVAEGMAGDGEVSRVILATDGDFNVGLSDPAALEDFIAGKRAGGTYLSVLGFGRGNLDDTTMQALAQNGNGTAAYIDTLAEAQKVLGDQLTGALFPIAHDVKLQVEFNPAVVAEYRLIGYETRALAREDFNNDRVDAGEIGAGLQVTALYEVTPVGSPARLNDPLRYAAEPATAQTDGAELAYLRIRWKDPGATESRLEELPVSPAPQAASDDTRFALAIAGFGQLLTGGKYLGDWGWQDAIALASGAKGTDAFGYRAEAVQMMRLAENLSR